MDFEETLFRFGFAGRVGFCRMRFNTDRSNYSPTSFCISPGNFTITVSIPYPVAVSIAIPLTLTFPQEVA